MNVDLHIYKEINNIVRFTVFFLLLSINGFCLIISKLLSIFCIEFVHMAESYVLQSWFA